MARTCRCSPPAATLSPRGRTSAPRGGVACATAGVPHVWLHDLRHLAQVYAAEDGATLPELMARLGHNTPAAAMVYLHNRTERDTELAAALGRAISAESPPNKTGSK